MQAEWRGTAEYTEYAETEKTPTSVLPCVPRIPRLKNRSFEPRITNSRTSSSDFGLSPRCRASAAGRPSFGFRPSASCRAVARAQRVGFRRSARLRAFTLIELLIVISIMAILASMIIPISGAVSRNRTKAKARAELEQVATAIELYKAKLGHYPPDNPRDPSMNQLYFELLGTTATNFNGKPAYITLDGSARAYSSSLQGVFGAAGIINSSLGSSGDEGRVASPFLRGLKPGQYTTITNAALDQSFDIVKVLTPSVPGALYVLNPVRYVSSNPTNNPNGFDLWVDFVINGKTNRVSNWSQQTLILP
jgi:prepilin-type N-terminal cleavage/methylation domain-containing protein